jgi:hypothetical protein
MEWASISLSKFLDSKRALKEGMYTHVGSGGSFTGKYYIKNDDEKLFERLYKEALDYDVNLTIGENHRIGYIGPIFLDFDFKQHSKERIYTKNHIKQIYDIVLEEASRYVEIEENNIYCYVLEKPAPRTDKTHPYKDGFHLQFPDIVTDLDVQHIIRENILKSDKLNNIFADVPILNTFEDVYDEAVISTNPHLMYGSTKDAKRESSPWTVSYMLTGKSGEEQKCELDKFDLVKTLSVRRVHELQKKVKGDEIIVSPLLEDKEAEVAAYKTKKITKKEKKEKKRSSTIECI